VTTLPALAPKVKTTPWLAARLRGAIEKRLSGRDGALRLRESWSGRVRDVGRGAVGAEITVEDPSFYRALGLGGSIGAAEAYGDGAWTCDELPGLVALLVRNREVLDRMESGLSRLTAPLNRLAHLLRPNTRDGARKNIAAHYDLGNDFFELWLDETLTYSSGIFERPDATLAEASTAKLDRLCRKLELRPGDRLLEIGCGWGSMALHAAREYGAQVTTTTISEEQHALATERVAAAGLSDRVTVLKQDYRDLAGTWDKLVSVEMIEAVGAPNLETYTRRCAELVGPDGLFALQAITITDQHYESARDSVDFIKRHIFPGSFIPSVTAILDAVTKTGDLRLVHLEDFGPHYARTLQCWRENLRACRDRAQELGYDERFLRLWEYYLAYCEGGFTERFLGVSQMLFRKPRNMRDPILPELAKPAAR
jgi:cyclopropane-fatty-acyl-phospholipid synthase